MRSYFCGVLTVLCVHTQESYGYEFFCESCILTSVVAALGVMVTFLHILVSNGCVFLGSHPDK